MAGRRKPVGVHSAPRAASMASRAAQAVWYTAPGIVELRPTALAAAGPGEALVRMLYSGVSRGTERLVHMGAVGTSEWERMRAPFQEGSFPFPVKYGYCAAGIVEAGPKELLGRTVFCLHPHQERFLVPADRLTVVPEGIPARRATLAANMETALNALWDSGAGPADRIAVVGAGIVGLLVAYLAVRLPGAEVTVVDIANERRGIVEQLGAHFSCPPEGELARRAGGGEPEASRPTPTPQGGGEATPPADIVFHTSASAAGLATAIGLAGFEATVVELSWYGDRRIEAPLGGAFHSQRLRLVSSQVGSVAASRRPRWGYARRMAAAMRLLSDPILDGLVMDEIAFHEAPARLPALLTSTRGLAPVIRYD